MSDDDFGPSLDFDPHATFILNSARLLGEELTGLLDVIRAHELVHPECKTYKCPLKEAEERSMFKVRDQVAFMANNNLEINDLTVRERAHE